MIHYVASTVEVSARSPAAIHINAENGKEALAIFREHFKEYTLIALIALYAFEAPT